jgi:hypothetical protein
MTPTELLIDFELGPGDPRQSLLQILLFSRYLADHVDDLRDAGDFKQFLLDIAEAARIFASTKVPPLLESGSGAKVSPQPRWKDGAA